MIKKQIFLNLSKGPDQRKPKLEAEEKAATTNAKTPSSTGTRRTIHFMKTLTITTIMRITEVNPEAVDLIETNILDNFSEVKILVVEANVLNTHTKVNIKVTIIKVITTKATMVYTTIHGEAINRVTIMANLEAEAMVMAEVITTDAVAVGLIIQAKTTINTISIMVMMITSLINMAHHVHYVVAIIIPPNIVLRESMILMT